MTTDEIRAINELRDRGLGYKKIAAQTGLPVNSVKTYCRRHKVNSPTTEDEPTYCRFCGKSVKQLPKTKTRFYCSDTCRMRYWSTHRDQVQHRVVYSFRCPYCGQTFSSAGNPNRKYCSRACADNARRKAKSNDGR